MLLKRSTVSRVFRIQGLNYKPRAELKAILYKQEKTLSSAGLAGVYLMTPTVASSYSQCQIVSAYCFFIYFFKLELSVACGCILSDFVSFLLFWRSGCQTLPWCQSWKRCEHYCNPVDHPDWRPGMLTLYPSQCIQCQQNILYALSLVHSTEMTICIRSVLKNPVHTGLIPTQEPVGFYVEKIYRNVFFFLSVLPEMCRFGQREDVCLPWLLCTDYCHLWKKNTVVYRGIFCHRTSVNIEPMSTSMWNILFLYGASSSFSS